MDIYQIEINSKNEFEVLENLVTLYSCYKNLAGVERKRLRYKLVTLLSIYIKYGYNKESKQKALEQLGVKRSNLNCLNSELRDGGFLIKSDMNTRDSFLHPELKELSDYYNRNKGLPPNVLFTLHSHND